jgi:hypothetical protein
MVAWLQQALRGARLRKGTKPPRPAGLSQEEVLKNELAFPIWKWTATGLALYLLVVCFHPGFDFDQVIKRSAVRASKAIERTRPASSHNLPLAILIQRFAQQRRVAICHAIVTPDNHSADASDLLENGRPALSCVRCTPVKSLNRRDCRNPLT